MEFGLNLSAFEMSIAHITNRYTNVMFTYLLAHREEKRPSCWTVIMNNVVPCRRS